MIRSLFALITVGLVAAQKTYQIPVRIGANSFQLDYSPDTQSMNDVARAFCIQHSQSFGYTNERPLTEENMDTCTQPLSTYITQQLNAQNAGSVAPPATKPPSDLYRVVIPVNGKRFELQFRPDAEPFERTAANFCIEQQAELGYNEANPLTQGNLPDCMGPIARYLQASVDQYRQQQQAAGASTSQATAQADAATQTAAIPAREPATLRVRVPIDNKVFEIFLTEGQYVSDIARKFCIDQHLELGYSPTNPLTDANIGNCVNPIAAYLQSAINQFNQQPAPQQQQPAAPQQQPTAPGQLRPTDIEGLYASRVTIGENTYEIRFRPAAEPVNQVAQNFCVQQAASLGVTQETLPNCVNVVGEYLAKGVQGLSQ